MSIIYEPRGKAFEYSPLAANLYKGCNHKCEYCFAPSATFTSRANFNAVTPRKNILALIEKDAVKYSRDSRPVLLCFTCDPYPKAEESLNITRMTLLSFQRNAITTTILTKSGLRACRDFDILSTNKKNSFGVTLTLDNKADSEKWEPGASLPEDRIMSLKIAKNNGIKTWVSFEPVINPNSVFRLIERTAKFVDLYKVGKLNYHPLSKEINWPEFRENIISKLTKMNKKFYIKKDLLKAI